MTSFQLNWLCEDRISNYSHILRYQGLGFQHLNLRGDTIEPIAGIRELVYLQEVVTAGPGRCSCFLLVSFRHPSPQLLHAWPLKAYTCSQPSKDCPWALNPHLCPTIQRVGSACKSPGAFRQSLAGNTKAHCFSSGQNLKPASCPRAPRRTRCIWDVTGSIALPGF